MSRILGKGVLRGLVAALVLVSAAAAEPPAKLKLAQDLARAHSVWPPGKEWLAKNQTEAGKLMIPVLNRCVADSPEGELTAFSVYLRLSKKGQVLEVVTDVDETLGRCMTKEAKGVRVPDAPRDDFWIQVNLAANL